ncbi:hydroxyisourate hydrolase [Serratia quinivorans]|uniref:hydroxyisourate hydrolase n=1 Tax=Serratia quinivorans TaxID=137545 RepID=UPI0021779539|nr:hydroxyisourate hydrolase [Serratia quinivorans]CAI0972270.1 5-hydroxyisourate hydrolase precursor [Serratia quinivorans]CAI0988275.1 5-hydroxyisourate hydrolase precursor [Serratia quinivorans]CAI1059064.1 5-hydroxyisourate hydrolase precursor [Serratia quinivorans]CAI1775785.1 5-hydroxyisourate hydrolase precursor [Serratia quinivorans]CAI2124745.1 5-hydroxyisourate hydrolase precursor [Serratia quinivorans]
MFKTKMLLTGLLLNTAISACAFAASNPLSVHVLNLQNGLPSAGVNVILEKQEGEKWVQISNGMTNEQGRISALYPTESTMDKGSYRVTFKTGEWFDKHNTPTFFPEIPVIFKADGSVPHYHIPLLVSPYGFSSYRGN